MIKYLTRKIILRQNLRKKKRLLRQINSNIQHLQESLFTQLANQYVLFGLNKSLQTNDFDMERFTLCNHLYRQQVVCWSNPCICTLHKDFKPQHNINWLRHSNQPAALPSRE